MSLTDTLNIFSLEQVEKINHMRPEHQSILLQAVDEHEHSDDHDEAHTA